MRILLLEDEFLIAMDVEQLCRDNGAREVVTVKDLDEIEQDKVAENFDAAILDVMVSGTSTLGFARRIRAQRLPFIFASGYTDMDEVFQTFPGIPVVDKPYSGGDLIEALAAAISRLRGSGRV
ncbi:response regulator [Mesorhizobium soli]|uniref:Response regulator n=2 Tax=Pseudaminobacter soli (ex Li et al. 2025) TaxID=1295366 RepID=A0A2P7SAF8_9HYPH|nr:response regulator [Mesorhizobium soli]